MPPERTGERIRSCRKRSLSVAGLLALLLLPAPEPGAREPTDPSAATVLVRVRLEADPDAGAWSAAESADATAQGVAGSAFLIGGSGYLLTDAALLRSVESGVELSATEIVVTVFPGEESSIDYEAAFVAVDDELGLALLEIDVDRRLAHLRLGDSDVLSDGQRLSVLGWSIVEDEEDGPGGAELVTSRFVHRVPRSNDSAPLPLIPLRGKLEPGSEGGAVVDGEGYVVAVARRGEEGAGAVGVPINAVKEFLLLYGPAGELPRQLSLGPPESLEEKGLRMRLVDGLVDTWPGRTRFDSPLVTGGVGLRIDRLASPLALGRLEADLLAGGFGSLPAARAADGSSEAREIRGSRTRLLDSARFEREGRRYAVEYLVIRVGDERIVARYEAQEELAAFNRSLLRQSLESVEVTRFLMLPLKKPLQATMETARFAVHGAPEIVMPGGWHREPVSKALPDGLPVPDDLLSASPTNDYTVTFAAYFWRSESAAGSAARDPGPLEQTVVRHGLEYWSRSIPVPAGAGVVLLECRAPTPKADLVREACLDWESAVAEAMQ